MLLIRSMHTANILNPLNIMSTRIIEKAIDIKQLLKWSTSWFMSWLAINSTMLCKQYHVLPLMATDIPHIPHLIYVPIIPKPIWMNSLLIAHSHAIASQSVWNMYRYAVSMNNTYVCYMLFTLHRKQFLQWHLGPDHCCMHCLNS